MTAAYYKVTKTVSKQMRIAHIEVTNGKVTAASPATAFMIGWTLEHVRGQATKYGFKVITLRNGSRNTTFVVNRPTISQRLAARSQ